MAAGDLTTLPRVKAYLGETGAESVSLDPFLSEAITRESDWMRSQLGRKVIAQAQVTETRSGDGSARLLLREYPIAEVSSVEVDGSPVPKRTAPGGDGWVLRQEEGSLELVGYRFAVGVENVSIVYTAGYAPVPGDIEEAVIERVALTFHDRARVGVAQKVVAGETMDYRGGAQLPRIMAIIEKYRRWGVG